MTASLSAPTQRAAWLEHWLSELPPAAGPLAAVQQRGRDALVQQGVPSSRRAVSIAKPPARSSSSSGLAATPVAFIAA